VEYQPNIVPRLVIDISFDVGTVKLATYWMLQMSAQCYEYRFGYCTNVKTCFNVHFRPILAEMLEQSKFNIFKLCETKLLLVSILAPKDRCMPRHFLHSVSETRHPLVTIISLNLKPIFGEKYRPLRRSRSIISQSSVPVESPYMRLLISE